MTNKQIIVVDDNIEVYDLLSNYFKAKGFNVINFRSAKEAIDKASKNHGKWDILLTDYHFKDLTKDEFIKGLDSAYSDLPVLQISSSDCRDTEILIDRIENNTSFKRAIRFKELFSAINANLNSIELTEIKGENKLGPALNGRGNRRENLIGISESFSEAIDLALKAAPSSANILITGDSGTGKEAFANFIHNNSKNKGGCFTAINCSAIPENLLESELFGHMKGSFTGANETRIGLFEMSKNGTVFLDEIGDLSLPLQAKLLRVLQEKRIRRVGENNDRAIHCRIISATHKNLIQEINDNRFREDLFFRLNVIPIKLPVLRDRKEDILPLANNFLIKFANENNSNVRTFSKEAVKFLLEHSWKGNVRELENTIERAVVLCEGPQIGLKDLGVLTNEEVIEGAEHVNDQRGSVFSFGYPEGLPSLEDIVNSYIKYAVDQNDGARDRTAREIGVDRKTLYKRLLLYSS